MCVKVKPHQNLQAATTILTPTDVQEQSNKSALSHYSAPTHYAHYSSSQDCNRDHHDQLSWGGVS